MKVSQHPFILFEDDRWLVVNKPYGLPTHGGDPGDIGVQEWLALHLDRQTFVCSRLDKGTTGVLLLAKTAEASAQAQRIHEDESSEKIYYFLSDKNVSKNLGEKWVCENPLDDKTARTEFSFDTKLTDQVFRYRAVIRRGRMHQIRRHAAMSGCALLGDEEYGGTRSARLALHCAELYWPSVQGKISAPLPEVFYENAYHQGLTSIGALTALDRRGTWLSSVTSAWRVVQRGELVDFDLSLDVYGSCALVWVYDDADFKIIAEKLAQLFDSLKKKFAVEGAVFRRIAKNPHKKGLIQDTWMLGHVPSDNYEVIEHNWKALVNVTARQHVGLFLDHRDNRRRVQKQSSGKRVANLFSYTCAFGIVAAKVGCEVVMNVDAAASALNIGKQNFELNDLSAGRTGKFIERDVRIWLEKQLKKKNDGEHSGWDIIICDPPTFSSTQAGGIFHVSQEWIELANACSRLMTPEGICYFSTNCQTHERGQFEKTLQGFFAHVQRLRPPIDFPEISGRTHAHFFECKKPRL